MVLLILKYSNSKNATSKLNEPVSGHFLGSCASVKFPQMFKKDMEINGSSFFKKFSETSGKDDYNAPKLIK